VGRIEEVRIKRLDGRSENSHRRAANYIHHHWPVPREKCSSKLEQTAAALIKATEVMILRV